MITYLPLTKDNIAVGLPVICRYTVAFPSANLNPYGKTGTISEVVFWGGGSVSGVSYSVKWDDGSPDSEKWGYYNSFEIIVGSVPVLAKSTAGGMKCNKCLNGNDYAEPNQPDGSYRCYSCRN